MLTKADIIRLITIVKHYSIITGLSNECFFFMDLKVLYLNANELVLS